MTTKSKAADAASTSPDESTPDESTSQPVTSPDASTPLPVPDESTDADAWGNWEFIGEHQLTYAAIPVTVEPGDVITHPGLPADDGRWVSTDAEVTRHRDNHHQEG